MSFKKDDICICSYPLRKNIKKGETITKKNCKVRIHAIQDVSDTTNSICYRVYNIDFERYENIADFYLKLDLEETRNFKLKQILND